MKKIRDLTGFRFGQLTAIRFMGVREKSKQAIWLWKCDCGKEKELVGYNVVNGSTKSCGCLRWSRGGEKKEQYKRQSHNGKNVRVHRVIMEQILGRSLTPEESVHHKNGDRHDNRPENLELFVTRHLGGQRVEDLIEFAINILHDYAPEKLSMATKVFKIK